jgi:hypothetical protein
MMEKNNAKAYFRMMRGAYLDLDDDNQITFESCDRYGEVGFLSSDDVKLLFMSLVLRFEAEGLGQWVQPGHVEKLKSINRNLKKRTTDFMKALDKASDLVRNDSEEELLNIIWDAVPDAEVMND